MDHRIGQFCAYYVRSILKNGGSNVSIILHRSHVKTSKSRGCIICMGLGTPLLLKKGSVWDFRSDRDHGSPGPLGTPARQRASVLLRPWFEESTGKATSYAYRWMDHMKAYVLILFYTWKGQNVLNLIAEVCFMAVTENSNAPDLWQFHATDMEMLWLASGQWNIWVYGAKWRWFTP